MAEKAARARHLAELYPDTVQVCPEDLPWIWDEECELWLSLDGNYSGRSPEQKHELRRQSEIYQRTAEMVHEQRVAYMFAIQEVWSMTRRNVLERDKYTCRICGDHRPVLGDGTLHIHHILKREEGGTDHFDNLLTVCNRCHKKADTKLYNPDWSKAPV